MKITKNWFYKSQELNTDYLFIEDNLDDVVLFDNDDKLQRIEVWNNSTLNYFSYFYDIKDCKKHIIWKWENSHNKPKHYTLQKNDSIKLKIIWEASNNSSKIDMNILALIWEWWFIDLDGILKINKNLEKIKWHLKEINIYLGEKWKIKSIPTLEVASDDVEASHSCKIERISDDDLFYLRSRGIERNNAVTMMLRNYISWIFSWLWKINREFCSGIVEDIFERI